MAKFVPCAVVGSLGACPRRRPLKKGRGQDDGRCWSDRTLGEQPKRRRQSRPGNADRIAGHVDPDHGRTDHLLVADLEQRYGFACSEALGRTSHQLLRTIFPLKLPEIEATLANQKTSSGMLIHRHADGRAVMTVNHWHVHHDIGNHPCAVTEVHSDIAQGGEEYAAKSPMHWRCWRVS